MRKIKEAYYFFFYKIYKSIEYTSENYGNFLTDFKTVVVIGVLEIWGITSLSIYLKIYIDINFTKSYFVSIGLLVTIVNYLYFFHTDIWKEYNNKFDRLPKRINRNGSWIVFGIVLFIVTNLILSFYLYYQID